jgi:hypothetical protein
MRTCAPVGVLALLLSAGVAVAADAIKVDLKAVTFDPTGELYGYDDGENRLFLYTNGKATAAVELPEDGEYTVVVEASCSEAQGEKAKIKLTVGDTVLKDKFELTSTDAKEYKFDAKLKKGATKLSIEFLNDKFKEGEYDLNLYVHGVRIEKK